MSKKNNKNKTNNNSNKNSTNKHTSAQAKRKHKSRAELRAAQEAREERQRQELLERELGERRQAMLQDALLGALLFFVFFLRGWEFDALGQLLGLAISWVLGLLVLDVWRLARRRPRPVGLVGRVLPAAALGVVFFVVLFVVPFRLMAG